MGGLLWRFLRRKIRRDYQPIVNYIRHGSNVIHAMISTYNHQSTLSYIRREGIIYCLDNSIHLPLLRFHIDTNVNKIILGITSLDLQDDQYDPIQDNVISIHPNHSSLTHHPDVS